MNLMDMIKALRIASDLVKSTRDRYNDLEDATPRVAFSLVDIAAREHVSAIKACSKLEKELIRFICEGPEPTDLEVIKMMLVDKYLRVKKIIMKL